MIENMTLKPMYLAFLVALVYFALVSPSAIVFLLGLVVLVALISQYDAKIVSLVFLVLISFIIYFSWVQHEAKIKETEVPSQVNQLRLVPDSISVNGDLLSARASDGTQRYQVYYQVKSGTEKKDFQNLKHLVEMEVEGEVEKPTPKRNFKGFDYEAYLRREGIFGIVRISQIKSLRQVSPKSPIEWVRLWRRKLLVHIDQSFPAPMKHYMTGLLLGYLDKSFDEMSDIYTDLGIIHLFALSGMQVGFFIGIFRYLVLRLGLLREHFIVALLPFAFIYAGLTGFTISVVRSLLQAILSQFGCRKWDNLGVTMLILFIISPHFLQTTGGALSFAYAFILSTLDLERLSDRRKAIAESLVLSLGILPLLMFYFGTFQPLSILLTACFSIIFDLVILPLLSLVLLCSPLVDLSLFNPCFSVLELLIKWTAVLSPRPMVFGSPSFGVLVIMLILLACLHDFWQQKKWRYCCLLGVLFLFGMTKHPLENEVTILDIGQGDSILIRDMTGKTLLIDTGGRVDFSGKEAWQQRQKTSNAERTSIPYLKSRGLATIDQLLITHTDTDHMGDMQVLAKHFKIKEILTSPGSMTKPSFVKQLKDMKIKVRLIQAGDCVPIMGSKLQVLYPWSQGDGGNNDSLVLYGKLLDKRFLFTGDLEREGELDLVKQYPHLPVDILKAGHHGSKGSSDSAFLNHIGADVALVSAGANNRYKHPNQENLERFEAENMLVYRTDQQGAIRFKGWRKWHVETVR